MLTLSSMENLIVECKLIMYTSIMTIYEFVVIFMYLTRNCSVYVNKIYVLFCSVKIHICKMCVLHDGFESTHLDYSLFTCLSESVPNNAKLESFQSYCFCFINPAKKHIF